MLCGHESKKGQDLSSDNSQQKHRPNSVCLIGLSSSCGCCDRRARSSGLNRINLFFGPPQAQPPRWYDLTTPTPAVSSPPFRPPRIRSPSSFRSSILAWEGHGPLHCGAAAAGRWLVCATLLWDVGRRGAGGEGRVQTVLNREAERWGEGVPWFPQEKGEVT